MIWKDYRNWSCKYMSLPSKAPQRYNAHDDRGVQVRLLFGWWIRAKFGCSDHISLFWLGEQKKKMAYDNIVDSHVKIYVWKFETYIMSLMLLYDHVLCYVSATLVSVFS